MATVLSLTDGTTTINLNSSPIMTQDAWQPGTPELDNETIRNVGDGDALGTPTWRNVTETLPLLITGTASEIATQIQALEQMVDKARQNRVAWNAVRVYLQVKYSHDGSTTWRSEVLAGRVVPGNAARLALGSMEVALILTRRYFWEGPETQLELSSAGTGTPTTGYVTVYNDDDATANSNWFQTAAAQVTGDIPSPLKLEVKNNSGATREMRAVFLGNYVWMDPTNIDPIRVGSGSSVNGATYTWATDSEVTTHRWALNDALMADVNGQYVRVLVAFSTRPASDTLVRASLQFDDAGVFIDLLNNEQVRNDGNVIMDLGAMPLPPGAYVATTSGLRLALKMQRTGGTTATVDWVQVMPAGHGVFRQLASVTGLSTAPNGAAVVDDPITGVVYTLEAGGTYRPNYRGFGAPLHVWPGKTQRFRLMVQGIDALEAGEAYQVKAWVRPRRLTV